MSDTDYFRRNAAADIPDLDALDFDAIPIDLSGIPDFSNVGDVGDLGDLGLLGINTDLGNINIDQLGFTFDDIFGNTDALATLRAQDPEAYNAIMQLRVIGEGDDQLGGGELGKTVEDQSAAETERLKRQADATPEGNAAGIKSGVPVGDPNDPTGIKKLEEISKGKTLLERLLSGDLKEGDLTSLLKGLGAAYMAKKAYDEGQEARNYRRGATAGKNTPVTASRTAFQGTTYSATGGGIGSLEMARGGSTLPPRYLDGHSDGMADKVPAKIDNQRPAALSDGEFVIPADVVSHLGNGNSRAGASRLYEMMDRIRHARTGNTKQGRQINPDKFLPR